MRPNPRVGGGGSTRPKRDDPRPPQLGMPQRGMPPMGGGRMQPPDLNGAQRGGGYGGAFRGMDWSGGGGASRPKPGGMPQGPPQPDYFGQLNAFQADIGGEQPGPIQQGWGGAGGGSQPANQMYKVNSWLNTFQDPAARAQAMNGIGYFNGGTPFDPASARGGGLNRFNRQNARENQQTGGYSAPGTYLHQSGGYGAQPGEAPDLNFGGYIGATNVGDDGAAQYSPFAPKSGGRTRRTRNFGQVAY